MGIRRRYWAVLKTKQASSKDARKHVSNQNFEFYHPMYRERLLHGVRRVMPMFPFYLLVRINERKQDWRVLCSTRGVSSVLLNGGVPSRVLDEDVQSFRDLENELGYCELEEHEPPRFTERQGVRAVNGLFAGCEGIYQGTVKSHERVRVLFQILGRPKVVEMKAFDLVAA
jgi:transcription antitermination factor NusG